MQYVEGEYMKAEDYDIFLDDPNKLYFAQVPAATTRSSRGSPTCPAFRAGDGLSGIRALAMALNDPDLAASLQLWTRGEF